MGVTVKRSVVCLLFFLLPTALVAANSTVNSDQDLVTITVLRSDTRPLVLGSEMVEQGCSGADYSASCRHSADQFVQNMMVVETQDGKKFTIACTIDSRWSNCVPLPVGESFRARIEKNDLSIAYIGSKGRAHKQRYRVLPDAAFDAVPASTK